MGKVGHSEEEIVRVLLEAESGDTVVDVCRKNGISQQTFNLWKKKVRGPGVAVAAPVARWEREAEATARTASYGASKWQARGLR